METLMKTVALRQAEAELSALVEAAENGEATILTKHGRPAAMLILFADGQRLSSEKKRSFADLLLSISCEFPW
jgi:prevent-host-death family protein